MSQPRIKWQQSKIKIKALAAKLRRKRPRGWMMATLIVSGCAKWPEESGKAHSEAIADFQRTRLSQRLPPEHSSHSGFRLLSDGTEAFAARLTLADLAEKTLDLQYYMIRNDEISKTIAYSLVEAAERGVRVRILIDDLYALGAGFELSLLNAHENIEIRVFNPFRTRGSVGWRHIVEFIGNKTRLNRRMHNKMFIADNSYAIVGGRNIANEYFNVGDTPSFVDLDVLAVGPIVRQTSTAFDAYWNSEFAIAIDALYLTKPKQGDFDKRARAFETLFEELRSSAYAEGIRTAKLMAEFREQRLLFVWGDAHVEYDSPSKALGKLHLILGDETRTPSDQLLNHAKQSVVMISPYFVPGPAGVIRLGEWVQRGVQVSVLTNALVSSDHAMVHTGYARYRKALLKNGVILHEMKPDTLDMKTWRREKKELGRSRASLHAKAIVIDGRYTVIGSGNLDPRSSLYNTEAMYVIDSTELAAQVLKLHAFVTHPEHSFKVQIKQNQLQWLAQDKAGKSHVFTHEPMTRVWRRAWVSILSWLTPESML